jgi:hypothetical protein
MNRVEVHAAAGDLVVLNDSHASDKGEKRDEVEGAMEYAAGTLLLACVRRLDDEDSLNERENANCLGKRVTGEEDDRAAKNSNPNPDDEDPDAELGENTGAYDVSHQPRVAGTW